MKFQNTARYALGVAKDLKYNSITPAIALWRARLALADDLDIRATEAWEAVLIAARGA